jgi:DnaK suppressor protein
MSQTGLITTDPIVNDDLVTRRRRELVAVRASSLEQIEQMQTAAVELVDDGGSHDTVDDEGFGEGATLEIERGRVLALATNAANRIEQVDAALRRIDSGAYGICERCRLPIAPARLEAMPEATRCVQCASHTALRHS